MIRIITDSTCEGPPELLAHPAITVVPLSVVFGQTSLRDGIDITREEFWERLPKSDPLPTTSQATPGDFLEPFQRFTAAGDEVIAILISSKLSGTYDSAIAALADLTATAGPDASARVSVVDTFSISVGLGLMVQEAVTMLDAGATRAEIVDKMMAMRQAVHILFSLETLEYLQRGGRIGKAQAFMGTLLKLKPLLGIVDGEVVPVSRVRSKHKALEAMLDLLGQQELARGPSVRLAVTQADAPVEAAQVAQALSERFESPHVFISSLGPVVGTHVGPGTIGAAVYAGG